MGFFVTYKIHKRQNSDFMPFTLHYIVKKFASETLVNTTILKKC